MQDFRQADELAMESDAELSRLPVVIGPGSMPVYPTTDGVFDTAYGCSGNDAQPFDRARIETGLALKQDELEKDEKRRHRHEILEDASTDLFENMPPALLNAFLYSREHELGSALFNAAAALPLLGSLMVRGKRGLQAGSSAVKQLPYYPRIARPGSTSVVSDYGPGEVLKEMIPVYRETGVLVDLKPGEKEKLAELIVAATTSLRAAMGEIIPETRLAGPGFIRQTKLEGHQFLDLHWKKWLPAWLNMRRARKQVEAWAKKPVDNETLAAPLPKGWQWRIDLHGNNFKFDENGNVKGLFDPFWLGHGSWWDYVHPWYEWVEKQRK